MARVLSNSGAAWLPVRYHGAAGSWGERGWEEAAQSAFQQRLCLPTALLRPSVRWLSLRLHLNRGCLLHRPLLRHRLMHGSRSYHVPFHKTVVQIFSFKATIFYLSHFIVLNGLTSSLLPLFLYNSFYGKLIYSPVI